MVINKNRGELVRVEINLTNTGTSAIKFDLAFEFDTMQPGDIHWTTWFSAETPTVINPGETKAYFVEIPVAADAPLDLYYSVGANVYPLNVFNSNYTFGNYDPGDPTMMDYQNIATHEFGHAVGLGHPEDTCTEETMYAFAAFNETKKRTLEAGDIAGVNDLY